MLGNIEATTHVESKDSDPDIPAEEKIARIRKILESDMLSQASLAGSPAMAAYELKLPFSADIAFQLSLAAGAETAEDEVSMHLTRMDLGDKALYGQGLGTLMLRRAVQIGYEKALDFSSERPRLATLQTGRANLSKLNTIAKVMGRDNISVWMRGHRYGHEAPQPLDQVLNDFEYQDSAERPYLLQEVCAVVKPEVIFEGSVPPFLQHSSS